MQTHAPAASNMLGRLAATVRTLRTCGLLGLARILGARDRQRPLANRPVDGHLFDSTGGDAVAVALIQVLLVVVRVWSAT